MLAYEPGLKAGTKLGLFVKAVRSRDQEVYAEKALHDCKHPAQLHVDEKSELTRSFIY